MTKKRAICKATRDELEGESSWGPLTKKGKTRCVGESSIKTRGWGFLKTFGARWGGKKVLGVLQAKRWNKGKEFSEGPSESFVVGCSKRQGGENRQKHTQENSMKERGVERLKFGGRNG